MPDLTLPQRARLVGRIRMMDDDDNDDDDDDDDDDGDSESVWLNLCRVS